MGNLAVLLGLAGHRVRGSDAGVYPPMDRILAGAGIEVRTGYGPANLSPTPDLVIVGNVCRPDHPEARAAIERGLSLASMPAALRGLVLRGRRPLVVAGTHGKTTTTALVAHLLEKAGARPGLLVGGLPLGRSSGAILGEGPWLAVEGDEYDSAFFEKRPKFLGYEPDGLIITSVEHDHVDIYPTWEIYRQAFHRLVAIVPRTGCLVACADSGPIRSIALDCPARVVTYGTARGADYRIEGVDESADGVRFAIRSPAGGLGSFEVPLMGLHNALNAAAALALCHEHAGVGIEVLRAALASFPGVARRQERAGSSGGVEVYDDFGHHPNAIALTIDALRARIAPGGRIVAVLRPASATGCRALHQSEYAAALARADAAVIAPLARTSIPEAERLDLARLARDIEAAGRVAMLAPSLDRIPEMVARLARSGDAVVFFSNTDPGSLASATLSLLGTGSGVDSPGS